MPKIPATPKTLKTAGRRLWKAILTDFELDAGAREILHQAARSLDRATEAAAAVDAEGLVIHDRFGQAKPHPALATEATARAQFLTAVKQLNLDIEPLQDGPGRPVNGD